MWPDQQAKGDAGLSTSATLCTAAIHVPPTAVPTVPTVAAVVIGTSNFGPSHHRSLRAQGSDCMLSPRRTGTCVGRQTRRVIRTGRRGTSLSLHRSLSRSLSCALSHTYLPTSPLGSGQALGGHQLATMNRGTSLEPTACPRVPFHLCVRPSRLPMPVHQLAPMRLRRSTYHPDACLA